MGAWRLGVDDYVNDDIKMTILQIFAWICIRQVLNILGYIPTAQISSTKQLLTPPHQTPHNSHSHLCLTPRTSKPVKLPLLKTINPNIPILPPRPHPLITQPYTRHCPRMPRKRPLAHSRPRIPHLNHAILRAAHNPQRIRCQRPNALDMPKIRTQPFLRRHGPEPDGAVEGTGEHVARGQGTRGLAGEGGAEGVVVVGGGRGGCGGVG